MSLLLKALKHAERGSELTLEPMDDPTSTKASAPPTAQAAADLMFAKQAAAERRRLTLLLVSLGVVVVGLATYFYLAIYMPWIFLPRPISAAAPSASPSPAAVTASIPAPVVSAPTPSAPAAAERPLNTAAAPAPTQPKPSTQPAEPVAPPAQLRHSDANPPVRKAPTVIAPRRDESTPRSNPPPQQSEPLASEQGVRIASGNVSSNSGVVNAYQLLQAGQIEDARRAYEKQAAIEPRNPDILLGLALIAQRQGRSDDAVQLYLRALDVDPKNTFAQSSLTTMVARADPVAAETKFKSLIAQQPAAYLYFGLGNVYAAQGKWTEAQQAYFDAQRLAPDASDYAYNLAISLEHIHQPRAALDYYARALTLARAKGSANFDVLETKARMQRLNNALAPAAAK